MQTVQLKQLMAVTQDSTANASQTLTVAAVTDQRIVVTKVEVTTSGASVGASGVTITLKNGTSAKWKTMIAASSAIGTQKTIDFGAGVVMSKATAANLEVTAGGSGVITSANMAYYVE